MDKDKRDELVKTITDLSELNRLLNLQARKIENKISENWKAITSEQIEEMIKSYDNCIEINNEEIMSCLKSLSDEYGWGIK